jgi:hypothetical protein
VIVLFACGGDDTSQTTAAPGTTSETAPPGGDSRTTTTMIASESPIAQDVGLASMVLLTPTEGVGERPDFAWEPVDGASAYKITVLAPDGSFYWGWLGPETSVPLGGFPKLIDGATGPRVVSGMTWTVVALDADLVPLAVGGPASLSR